MKNDDFLAAVGPEFIIPEWLFETEVPKPERIEFRKMKYKNEDQYGRNLLLFFGLFRFFLSSTLNFPHLKFIIRISDGCKKWVRQASLNDTSLESRPSTTNSVRSLYYEWIRRWLCLDPTPVILYKIYNIPYLIWTQVKRIPNRREEDYFDLYENEQFQPIPWYQKIFNFISQCLYFMTGPKFVVPLLGTVQQKRQAFWIQKFSAILSW